MEIWKGRPEITPSDHPGTVYRALLNSTDLWYREQSEESSWYWTKTAQDAWEALHSGYGIIDPDEEPLYPEGRWPEWGGVRLYMGTDQLEYTLVGYGAKLIDEDAEKYRDEIDRVDNVLRAIDKALDRKKY